MIDERNPGGRLKVVSAEALFCGWGLVVNNVEHVLMWLLLFGQCAINCSPLNTCQVFERSQFKVISDLLG